MVNEPYDTFQRLANILSGTIEIGKAEGAARDSVEPTWEMTTKIHPLGEDTSVSALLALSHNRKKARVASVTGMKWDAVQDHNNGDEWLLTCSRYSPFPVNKVATAIKRALGENKELLRVDNKDKEFSGLSIPAKQFMEIAEADPYIYAKIAYNVRKLVFGTKEKLEFLPFR